MQKIKIDWNNLKIGDRLIRTKGNTIIQHHVIYMGYWEGVYLIAENQNGFGVQYITLNQFLSEGTLIKVKYNHFDENAQVNIIDRVNQRIGKAYDLRKYNCEHFVNDVLNGVVESKQVQAAFAVGVGITLATLAYQNSKQK